MNLLTRHERALILTLLCEGQSIRAITRITGKSKNTVAKLLVDAGRVCDDYQSLHLRDLKKTFRVQVDEIWSFTYTKQKNLVLAKNAPEGAGDTWTWVAIDADNKLAINWLVGSRDSLAAMYFIDDLAKRLPYRVQLTSDGYKPYLQAVEAGFGGDIDYAILNKIYGSVSETSKGRYSPAECIGIKRETVEGYPNPKHVSTSFVERQNLTMRMHMRRFTRLTNGFSKKLENHHYAVALHFMYYNYVRQHQTLRVSPAMAAGVTDKLWNVEDIVALVEADEAEKPRKRGPYKKNLAAASANENAG